jgi:hypothetical protein
VSEETYTNDPSTEWGYWLDGEDSMFIVLPKLPMQRAGLLKPPFYVTRPDGKVLHVISRPSVWAVEDQNNE